MSTVAGPEFCWRGVPSCNSGSDCRLDETEDLVNLHRGTDSLTCGLDDPRVVQPRSAACLRRRRRARFRQKPKVRVRDELEIFLRPRNPGAALPRGKCYEIRGPTASTPWALHSDFQSRCLLRTGRTPLPTQRRNRPGELPPSSQSPNVMTSSRAGSYSRCPSHTDSIPFGNRFATAASRGRLSTTRRSRSGSRDIEKVPPPN